VSGIVGVILAADCRVVAALCTSREAKQLNGEYLQQVSECLQGKLQVASCDVADLVYVLTDFYSGGVSFGGYPRVFS
jgi:hypothetical protein